MKVWGDFLGPPRSTDKTTLIIKISKGAKIRNPYNQVPHLTQDTKRKVTNSQLDITNESQEVSPFPAGDHKTLLHQGMSEPVFYGDLVYKFKRIVGKPNFSDQFKKIVKRYIRVGYGLGVMRQSACLVLGPITVHGYGFLFGCTTVGQASDSVAALAWSFDRWVGAWCLSVAGPTVAQLEVFFSSDSLWVVGPLLCFIMVC